MLFIVAIAALFAAWPRPAAAAVLLDAQTPRYDRVYKVGLLEQLPSPPELVIFGGSRAQRFEPSFAEKLTGLPAFNFAVQNSRPEDVYAMSRLLFWRAPSVKLRCIWALQATTLSDSPLHPGLLAEPRLTQFLPGYLVAAAAQGVREQRGPRDAELRRVLGPRAAAAQRLRPAAGARDLSRKHALGYLSKMVPKVAGPAPYAQTTAKAYFERTLQLFNLHGVEPVLVVMPYQPTALAAFRAAGWDAKEEAFKTYLESLRGPYRFHVLDYTELASFHGDPNAFYDGAHVTAVNARRILVQAVKDAPQAFR